MLIFALMPVLLGLALGLNGFRRKGLLVQAQIVRCGKELETEFHGNVHVRNIFAIPVAVPVVEVLDHFVENHATVRTKKEETSQLPAHI